MLTSSRTTNILLIAMIAVGIGVVAMLASGVRGGQLDPPGAPASTDGVREPGTPISSLPFVITQPGHYYLTRSMSVPLASPNIGIRISADDVALDLGGFTIAGVDPLEQNAINVDGGRARVRISNGVLRNAVGVEASAAVDLRISGVAVYGSAFYAFRVDNGAVVEDCVVSGSGEHGFFLEGGPTAGSRVTIRRCLIEDSAVAGVYMSQNAGGVLIEDSVIKGNNTSQTLDRGGIVINDADDVTVRGNDMGFNNGADVYIFGDNNVVVDNMISCPTSIVMFASVNTFAPVNTTDPHTNRAHRAAC